MLHDRPGRGVPLFLASVGVLEDLPGLPDRRVAVGPLFLRGCVLGSIPGAVDVGHIRPLPVQDNLGADKMGVWWQIANAPHAILIRARSSSCRRGSSVVWVQMDAVFDAHPEYRAFG